MRSLHKTQATCGAVAAALALTVVACSLLYPLDDMTNSAVDASAGGQDAASETSGQGSAGNGSAGKGGVGGTAGAAGQGGTTGGSGQGGAAGGQGGSVPADAAEEPACVLPTHKICFGQCVLTEDPAFGCAYDSCTPCDVPNATAKCKNAKCGLQACTSPYGNCNQTIADGCEVNLQTDPANCGVCGKVCPTGLKCVFMVFDPECECTADKDCEQGGSGYCMGGRCICGSTPCNAGEVCVSADTCGTP